jgi:hypothetical protein
MQPIVQAEKRKIVKKSGKIGAAKSFFLRAEPKRAKKI